MALMPGATWRPLGSNPAVEGTMARYDILCYHTMVGSLWGTDAYFRQGGYSGTESHFGVGYDGQILQWQDTRYRADANLDGGDRVLSVETADMGPGFPAWGGSNVPRWTAAQIEANARIAVWAHKTHGIPLVLIPNTAQSSRGLGWHRQGIDPWRCATCERWSLATGKVCPGDRRVAQMPLVLNRAIQIRNGPSTEEEPTVSSWDDLVPDPAVSEFTGGKDTRSTRDELLRFARVDAWHAHEAVKDLSERVAALEASWDELVPDPAVSEFTGGKDTRSTRDELLRFARVDAWEAHKLVKELSAKLDQLLAQQPPPPGALEPNET
jgi:hypothetical protein